MQISKLIIGLLLMVSCFFVQADTLSCEEVKLKPVFMNGMFNDREDAIVSAKQTARRLQQLYGKVVIPNVEMQKDNFSDGYYLAYNDSEFITTQLSEVVRQFLFNSIYAPDVKYSEDEQERYLAEYKLSLLGLDINAIKHQVDFSMLLGERYKFMITTHSQGNIYFNILYNGLLKYFPDSFRIISVASPVVIDAPKNNTSMIVEKSDTIKLLRGIRDNHSSGNSNANNSDLTGHSFNSYINGDETSAMMNQAYVKFFNELYPYANSYEPCNGNVSFSVTSDTPGIKIWVEEKYRGLNDQGYIDIWEDGIVKNTGPIGAAHGWLQGNSYSFDSNILPTLAKNKGVPATDSVFLTLVVNTDDYDPKAENAPKVTVKVNTPETIQGYTELEIVKSLWGEKKIALIEIRALYDYNYDDDTGEYYPVVLKYEFNSLELFR